MWPILKKDLRLELRTRDAIAGLVVLVVLILLTFAFALQPERARDAAPAVVWVTLVFAGLLAVQRAFLLERENDAWYGLVLAPVDRGAIFAAKMAANLILLAIAQVCVVALVLVLLDHTPPHAPVAFVIVNALGLIGFSALATLFAAIAVRLRSREMLLPLLVLPLLVPIVIAAVEATRIVLAGGGLASVGVWVKVLATCDVIFTVSGWLLFEQLVVE